MEPLQAELRPKKHGLGHKRHHRHHHRHRKHGEGGGGEAGAEGGGGGGGEAGADGGGGEPRGRKRPRGGEKARRRKHAEAQRAAKAAAGGGRRPAAAAAEGPGLFGFINQQLGGASQAAGKLRTALDPAQPQPPPAGGGGRPRALAAAGSGGGGGGGGGGGDAGRRGLAAHADNVGLLKVRRACKGCCRRLCLPSPPQPPRRPCLNPAPPTPPPRRQAKIQHLQQMAERNKGSGGLSAQIGATLRDAEAQLAAARADARAAHKSVSDREAASRWVKF